MKLKKQVTTATSDIRGVTSFALAIALTEADTYVVLAPSEEGLTAAEVEGMEIPDESNQYVTLCAALGVGRAAANNRANQWVAESLAALEGDLQ